MVYKNKARDMRRAPLPSKAYKSARAAKRNARKRSRQHAREFTHKALSYEWADVEEQYDPHWDNMNRAGYDEWNGSTRSIKQARRNADNLGALMRWAQALANSNPNVAPDELYAKARSVLGTGYTADHALSHIENIAEFDRDPYYRNRFRIYTDEQRAMDTLEMANEIIAYIKDLWLKGRNKQIRDIARRFTSTVHTDFENMAECSSFELIYRRSFQKEEIDAYIKFRKITYRPRFVSIYTGEKKKIYKEYRRVASYDDIPNAVHDWFKISYPREVYDDIFNV